MIDLTPCKKGAQGARQRVTLSTRSFQAALKVGNGGVDSLSAGTTSQLQISEKQ